VRRPSRAKYSIQKEARMMYTVFAYEVTELTRSIEADSLEEAIAKAYRGSDTDWAQWSENSLGTNGVELVCAEAGETVYDAGTKAGMPTEEFDDRWL
jgi:hypothetical protein